MVSWKAKTCSLSLVVAAITCVVLSKGWIEEGRGCKIREKSAQCEAGHHRLTSTRKRRHQARGTLKTPSPAVTCCLGFSCLTNAVAVAAALSHAARMELNKV